MIRARNHKRNRVIEHFSSTNGRVRRCEESALSPFDSRALGDAGLVMDNLSEISNLSRFSGGMS
jgi:hypothetical protein